MPEWSLFELLCVGHQPEQIFKLHVGFHRITELFDSRMFQIVTTRYESKLGRHYICYSVVCFVYVNA